MGVKRPYTLWFATPRTFIWEYGASYSTPERARKGALAWLGRSSWIKKVEVTYVDLLLLLCLPFALP